MNTRDLFYIPLAVVTAPLWARKARHGWSERLAKIGPLPASTHPRLLLHAVSVGEVSALRGLIPLLTPHCEIVLSVTTDTGTARARTLFPHITIVRYPLDFSASVRRFLDAVRPDAIGLVELELWPNFIDACRRRSIPVCVINGRLSARSFKGYLKIRPLMRRSFASLAFAAVQDDEYARRFEAMGVASASCLVTGSMKWDAIATVDPQAPPPDPLADAIVRTLGIDRTRPLIVAGSTGPGEEALLHEVCVRAFPEGIQLLCAPRKPERFDQAAAAMPGCVRRSSPPPADQIQIEAHAGPRHARFLLDTIGELRAAYTLATVVVMGRSFINLHGSDPIEPVSLGKPTIIGPRVGDFESIVRALEADDALTRATADSLPAVLRGLVDDRGRREQLARQGIACIARHRGASARHAELLLALAARGQAGGTAHANGREIAVSSSGSQGATATPGEPASRSSATTMP